MRALFLLIPLTVSGWLVLRTHHPVVTAAAPPLVNVTNAYEAARRIELPKVLPTETRGLHNVFRLSPQIVSGSEPHGEEALVAIARMGVKTVISVDGKAPDAATAARHGLRYVHVPIQYRGIAGEEFVKIAKTFRELEGPFYVHCFHGKHRGPAGAAVGRLVLEGASREQALAEMRQWCGTSDKYEGLYRSIATTPLPSSDETRALSWDFPVRHPMKGYRGAMTEICRAHDALRDLAKRGWKSDPEHPDVDAVNEAEKLAALFDQGLELDEASQWATDFAAWAQESAQESRRLHAALVNVQKGQADASDRANAAFANVTKRCDSCHQGYRNH